MNIKSFIFRKLILSNICFFMGNCSLTHAMDYSQLRCLVESSKNNYRKVSICDRKCFEQMEEKGYKIIGFLGAGSSGQLYLAENKMGNRCALKFTLNGNGYQITPHSFNVCNLTELSEKYRGLFKKNSYSSISPLGDVLLYDNLQKNGIVNLGKNACGILGYEKLVNCGKFEICVVLDYIQGVPLKDYIKENKYKTTDVKRLLKDICTSLKIMYENDFLHRSIGISNILISNDGTVFLIDYERAIYKGLFEQLKKIQLDKFMAGRKLMDEDGDSFQPYKPKQGEYYDLECLRTLIDDVIARENPKYENDNQQLHNNIMDLKNSDNLEEFLEKVSKLN